MGTTKFLRRWLPLVILVVIAIAAWQTARISDTDIEPPTAIDFESDIVTPILSARRVPETLRAPVIDANLVPAVDEIVSGSAGFAACVTVEADDRVIKEVDPTVPLVPASNQKLLATYAALIQFGPDYRFTTTVRADGVITDGVLEGDLYFVGGGDPFLSTDSWRSQYEETSGRYHTRLEDLADAIVASGITQVTGSLLGDESLFDDVRVGPWAQRLIDQRQSGPLSALTVNEGHVSWPEVFTSSINRSQTDDPPVHAAQVLAALLVERGVSIGGTGSGIAPLTAVPIAEVVSPALIEVITHVNSYSNNYGAEILLKHLGVANAGAGTTRAGADAVFEILERQGIDMTGAVIDDGSGLAETDKVTCRLLSDLLDDAGPESAFAQTLSIGGERGSLFRRHDGTTADGHVFAKTGTLNGVTALSGYVESPTEDGSWITFTYIANGEFAGINEELKAVQEPFVEDLADYPEGPTIDDLDPAPAADADP